MICNDILSLICGIVDSFDGIVLTKPCILRKCENKIFQFQYALKNNFLIPKSYIGNSIETSRSLENGYTIINPIYTGKIYKKDICEIYQTSLFHSFNEDISLTPIYLQEYKQKSFEVRITVIDNKIFPIKIISKNKVDWRKDYEHNEYSYVKIPIEIENKILKMMKDFEIKFGCFDYIVDKENRWIFF